jgi:hypothetical protein
VNPISSTERVSQIITGANTILKKGVLLSRWKVTSLGTLTVLKENILLNGWKTFFLGIATVSLVMEIASRIFASFKKTEIHPANHPSASELPRFDLDAITSLCKMQVDSRNNILNWFSSVQIEEILKITNDNSRTEEGGPKQEPTIVLTSLIIAKAKIDRLEQLNLSIPDSLVLLCALFDMKSEDRVAVLEKFSTNQLKYVLQAVCKYSSLNDGGVSMESIYVFCSLMVAKKDLETLNLSTIDPEMLLYALFELEGKERVIVLKKFSTSQRQELCKITSQYVEKIDEESDFNSKCIELRSSLNRLRKDNSN